jgi:hypothetical protein
MLKKSVEQRTREVLEEATKQTEAEQAQKLQRDSVQRSPKTRSSRSTAPTTPIVGPKSSSSTENTPTQPPTKISPYSSPQEASYASLARSIAVAAAAAAVANGPPSAPPSAGIAMLGHNPFFNSSMMARSASMASMYSECTTISTPMSESPSFPGTPFEPSRVGETPLPSNDPSNIGIAHQFPDFAAAVDANILKRPTTLLHPRNAHLSSSDVPRRSGRPTLSRINSCPADFVDSFQSVAITTPAVERPQLTLAAVAEQQTKRRRPRLSPLGVGMARSKSSMGVSQSPSMGFFPNIDVQHLSIPQHSPTAIQPSKSTPTSPTDMSSEAINIKKVSPEKTFLAVDVPPTPISPSGIAATNINDAFNESPTLSLARAAGLTQLKRPALALHTEDIFSSPPATPAHSMGMGPPRAYSFASTTGDLSDVSSGMYDEHFSSSPTQMYVADGRYNHMVDDVFAMSYDLAQDEFDISNYLDI